jgi:hypothetical protein
MLPMLLGLGGSALAGAGMLGGMGALTAGAIGSGLGSYLETGDLGQGIQTGLMSFLGGKALGSMMGSGADAAVKAAPAMPANDAALQATGMGSPNVLGESIAATTPPAPSSTFGDIFSTTDPTKGVNYGTGFEGAKAAATTPYALGAAGTAGLMMPPPDFEKKEYDFNTDEAEAKPRDRFTAPSTFRGGIDPEFSYFGPQRFAEGGIADLPMGMEEEPNDKEIIADAVEAIKGIDENPEITLARFVSRYGEDALRDLVQRVQSGEFDQNAETTEGMVNGAGDGMDDMIPATLEGEQDVVLSDGEFIVPADVVSGLGNGSTDAGSKALYEMMDRVRELRTGQKEQPDQVPLGQMMPA